MHAFQPIFQCNIQRRPRASANDFCALCLEGSCAGFAAERLLSFSLSIQIECKCYRRRSEYFVWVSSCMMECTGPDGCFGEHRCVF